jgi:hypothetical protein
MTSHAAIQQSQMHISMVMAVSSTKQLKLSADSSWPCDSEIHMQQQQQLRVMLIKSNQW